LVEFALLCRPCPRFDDIGVAIWGGVQGNLSAVFREGVTLEALGNVDSRRFLPAAVAATALTIVAPALVVVALSPLSGIADVAVSALLACGLSVAAGTALGTLWARMAQSREIPFGDLMLWTFARRVAAERRLARDARRGDRDPELAALRRLTVVFEARDGASHGHSGRVARHAGRIARRMGLDADEVARIEAAASVHGIGLLGVPAAIRDNPDPTAEDRAVIARHADAGAERVAAASDAETAALVRHHHERWDGGGFPDGLGGELIPVGARIVAVADRFDELLSPAPGTPATGRRNALDQLAAEAGGALDPAVVAACAAYYSGTRGILGMALAATAPQRAVRWLAAAPAGLSTAGAPAVVQGVCAAGALAVAGTCLGGLPAAGDADRDRAPAVAERAARPAPPAPSTTEVARATPPVERSAAAGGGPAPPRDKRGSDRAPTGGGRSPSGGGGVQRPQAPAGTAPPAVAPRAGDDGGGEGGQTGAGGSGGGQSGGGSPGAAATPPAPAPVPAPATPSAPTVADTTAQVLDPVLDGVGETVPPVKPVTDTVKEVVNGLLGGGR